MESILETINKSALKFLAPLTPEETYKTIVDEGVKLVHGDDGLIVLKTDKVLHTVYGSTPSAANFTVRERGFTWSSITKRKAFVLQRKDFQYSHPTTDVGDIQSIIFIPLAYRNQAVGVLIVRNLHEEHFTEKELHILKLFGSMASMAINKVQLYHETVEAVKLRDEFVSLAAHELRTPLTTMNGYIQLLERKHKQDKTAEAEWIGELSIASIRLTRLINQLLDMNRLKSGRFTYQWEQINLLELIGKAIDQVEYAYPGRKITLKNATHDDAIIGDREKLVHMFFDFLDNAAKFSEASTPIVVEIKQIKKNICLRISDKGKGMEQKEVAKMFSGFYKGENNLKEGWGLGMFLAYTVIKEHHGKISLSSQRKKGTTVEIKLPLAHL